MEIIRWPAKNLQMASYYFIIVLSLFNAINLPKFVGTTADDEAADREVAALFDRRNNVINIPLEYPAIDMAKNVPTRESTSLHGMLMKFKQQHRQGMPNVNPGTPTNRWIREERDREFPLRFGGRGGGNWQLDANVQRPSAQMPLRGGMGPGAYELPYGNWRPDMDRKRGRGFRRYGEQRQQKGNRWQRIKHWTKKKFGFGRK